MKNSKDVNIENEIDVRETFLIIWNYKIFISIVISIGIFLSLIYSQSLEKEYTSHAIFKIEGETNNRLSLGSELSSFAGFFNPNSSSQIPIDQINGRVFIESLDKTLDFKNDPFYNTYNPNHVDPFWKAKIKRIIKWKTKSPNVQELIWQKIAKNYTDSVTLIETENGSLKVTVKHTNSNRAAEIANKIMFNLIADKKNNREKLLNKKLTYLAEQLAKAQKDLEISSSKLKTFTLQNSALPLETFNISSLNLNTLRDELIGTEKMLSAVEELSAILNVKEISNNDYLLLKKNHPIVDQVEFRRILGLNELISLWSWPEKSTVTAVYDVLKERKTRLKTDIKLSKESAEEFGEALEYYGAIKREAEISEASYQVLMEQVKSQSVLAGFAPDLSEVFNYASPSFTQTFPNQRGIILLGSIISLVFSLSLTFIFANLRNVSYSKVSLLNNIKPQFNFSIKKLKLFRNLSLEKTNELVHKKNHPTLRDLSIEIYKSGISHIVITSSKAKIPSYNIALALACFMQSKKNRIAIVNISNKKTIPIDKLEHNTIVGYDISHTMEYVYIINTKDGNNIQETISQKNYIDDLQKLKKEFNLLIMCIDDNEISSSLRALEGQNIFHITIAKTKRTKLKTLDRMQSLLPIQGLLYE
jgi:uncharacterized protein involved in exopolysaccharide biosynthesis